MQIKTQSAEKLEKDYCYSKLYHYQSKYPEEVVEFRILLDGGLVPAGSESSVHVGNWFSTSQEQGKIIE